MTACPERHALGTACNDLKGITCTYLFRTTCQWPELSNLADACPASSPYCSAPIELLVKHVRLWPCPLSTHAVAQLRWQAHLACYRRATTVILTPLFLQRFTGSVPSVGDLLELFLHRFYLQAGRSAGQCNRRCVWSAHCKQSSTPKTCWKLV